ncbi:MAG: hypothetical protein JTT14_02520 [Candidatus Brockarchaeota archaeon]|nr:hypothetical protein [Candidatus Brockarchaeota archaeon]
MDASYSIREGSDRWNEERKRKGEYRVRLLVEELTCKGYNVLSFPVEANGVDVIAENSTHVLGIEVLNWNERWTLQLKRLKCMIENWDNLFEELKSRGDKRNYQRVLVYSYHYNIKNALPYLLKLNVELWERGYQDIPEYKEERVSGWND